MLPKIHQSNECTENLCFEMSIMRRQEAGKVISLSAVKPERTAKELLSQNVDSFSMSLGVGSEQWRYPIAQRGWTPVLFWAADSLGL